MHLKSPHFRGRFRGGKAVASSFDVTGGRRAPAEIFTYAASTGKQWLWHLFIIKFCLTENKIWLGRVMVLSLNQI
jgi:hypothetical protein